MATATTQSAQCIQKALAQVHYSGSPVAAPSEANLVAEIWMNLSKIHGAKPCINASTNGANFLLKPVQLETKNGTDSAMSHDIVVLRRNSESKPIFIGKGEGGGKLSSLAHPNDFLVVIEAKIGASRTKLNTIMGDLNRLLILPSQIEKHFVIADWDSELFIKGGITSPPKKSRKYAPMDSRIIGKSVQSAGMNSTKPSPNFKMFHTKPPAKASTSFVYLHVLGLKKPAMGFVY